MKGIHQYLCPCYIGHYSDACDLVDDYKVQINDFQLLDFVDQVNWNLKQFVVLHMRSPHTPYEKNYPQGLEVFKKQKKESWAEKNIRTYNNSVHLMDLFVSKLITILDDKIKGRYHLFFLSDHGEAMGEGGRFGNRGLWPKQYQILLLYKRRTQDTLIEE